MSCSSQKQERVENLKLQLEHGQITWGDCEIDFTNFDGALELQKFLQDLERC